MANRGIVSSFKRWWFYRSYYPQLGLLTDDVLHEYPPIKEALRRLPKKELYEREFRISRAIQLSLQKVTLPKEEWTKYEEDKRYLQPYINDVEDELKEKMNWQKL